MFLAEAPSASFVAIARTTGLLFLRCAFTDIVTGVSVIPRAVFAIVFPVQVETTIISKRFLGPIGSASCIVFIP